MEVWRCGGVEVWRCAGVEVCRLTHVRLVSKLMDRGIVPSRRLLGSASDNTGPLVAEHTTPNHSHGDDPDSQYVESAHELPLVDKNKSTSAGRSVMLHPR